MNDIYMINDSTSSEDLLNFKRYLSPLMGILTNPKTETPFTIGVFGPWGSGKSTLIDFIDTQLRESPEVEFFRIKFNPWLYRDEKNLIVPLLHTLQDTLDESLDHRIVESAKKIGTVLTRIGAALFLKTVTANQITLDDVEKQEKVYLDQYRRAQSEIRGLRTQLQKVVDEVTNKGRSTGDRVAGRMVFFIDDLDRCEPDQIVALLESIKLFLDLKYCFFILALDEEVIHRAIQIKYADFDFIDTRKSQIGQQYLEKMIQLPLYLYPLTERDLEDYLGGLELPLQVKNQIKLFSEIMLPNPRKIKRIVNLFLLNYAVLQNNDVLSRQINNIAALARLIVLQVQDYDLYKDILANKEVPEYLSKVYRGEISINDETAWAGLKERREVVRNICKEYNRPGTWIERVFKPDNAFPKSNEIGQYFNMLGRGERG
ncbi:MAG TPA: P-loop NTPase fold protein [Pyrinomonadaceae bacterium]|nr:P-loop NTPase fold protein [Pyrinomonadaceae bacterium]